MDHRKFSLNHLESFLRLPFSSDRSPIIPFKHQGPLKLEYLLFLQCLSIALLHFFEENMHVFTTGKMKTLKDSTNLKMSERVGALSTTVKIHGRPEKL